jgi:hypothetical protein
MLAPNVKPGCYKSCIKVTCKFTCCVSLCPYLIKATEYCIMTRPVAALRYKLGGRGSDSSWGHEIFHWINTSGRTMTLGSTQPLTETRTSEGGRCVGLTTLLPSCTDCLEILEASASWSPNGLSRSVRTGIYNRVFFWGCSLRLSEKGLECIFDQFTKIFWLHYDAKVHKEDSFAMPMGEAISQFRWRALGSTACHKQKLSCQGHLTQKPPHL